MSSGKVESLGDRIRAVFALDPEAIAVEASAGRSRWADLAHAAERIEQVLQQAGIAPDMPVGWVARNRASAIFPDELAAQKLRAVVGDVDDWADQDAIAAAAKAGSLGIAVVGSSSFDVRVVPELSRAGAGPHRSPMPGYVLERLTSGTTGPPKRIPVLESVLVPSLQSAEQKDAQTDSPLLRLKSSPSFLLKPFGHAGGLFGLLLALYQARPMVLFEKF